MTAISHRGTIYFPWTPLFPHNVIKTFAVVSATYSVSWWPYRKKHLFVKLYVKLNYSSVCAIAREIRGSDWLKCNYIDWSRNV
jgi:hypothetical protein